MDLEDRGEVSAASLDATERLRARLTGKPVAAPPRPRPVLPWLIAAALLTFALGIIANPWFERTVRGQLAFAEVALPATGADPAEVTALKARLAALERRAAAAPMPSERLARTEAQTEATSDAITRNTARIDQIMRDMAALSAKVEAGQCPRRHAGGDVRSGGGAGARRAGAGRRAPRSRCGAPARAAGCGATPVVRGPAIHRRSCRCRRWEPGRLRWRCCDAIWRCCGPGSTTAPPPIQGRRTWLETLTDTLSSAVSSTPKTAGPVPVAPVDAAAAALMRGDAAGAARELRRLPDDRRAVAANWLAAADRLAIGDAALATLETATALIPG